MRAYEVTEWEFKDSSPIFPLKLSKPDSHITIYRNFYLNDPVPCETNEIKIVVFHDKKTRAVLTIDLEFKTNLNPDKKFERIDNDFSICSSSTKIDNPKLEEEIKNASNNFGQFYSKAWCSYHLDNNYLLIEDEPTYYKDQPFNIIFRSTPYRDIDDKGDKAIYTGLILIHKQFKTKILVSSILKDSSNDPNKPISKYWNNYYFITTTNTNTNEEIKANYFEEVEDVHQKQLRERREYRAFERKMKKLQK